MDTQNENKEQTTISAPKQVKKAAEDQSYGAIVKRQFKKNRPAVWSLRFIILIVVIGLFADFLAYDKPLMCKYEGKTYFPLMNEYLVALGGSMPQELNNIVDWKSTNFDYAIWAPIPYGQSETDFANANYVSPTAKQNVKSKRWWHWLGTDEIGRDVMSGMIHGTRIAMMVGVVSMSIASIIGIFMGAMAGYFGDEKLKASFSSIILFFLALPLAYFYGFQLRSYAIAEAFADSLFGALAQILLGLAIFIAILVLANLVSKLIDKIFKLKASINVPIDIIVSRSIEILISVPRLLLIMSIVAIAKPSIMLVMVIIGATSWTGIARFTRGELLRVRNLEYIEAAQSLGYSEWRTIFRHAIPNSLAPVLIAIAFGVAGAILTESFLSFLGIGVEAEVATWGKLLSLARKNFSAWWLALAPGFAIFITVTIYNLMGEGLTDALDPRLKQ
ncbi:MAG: ABC transporter permease [Chitinophagales bacterium]|nr:ABC transporter permease [Bacteroidota bacterium]MCB9256096.1 ABC transporter permease [Chitinophagales bacterium]